MSVQVFTDIALDFLPTRKTEWKFSKLAYVCSPCYSLSGFQFMHSHFDVVLLGIRRTNSIAKNQVNEFIFNPGPEFSVFSDTDQCVVLSERKSKENLERYIRKIMKQV